MDIDKLTGQERYDMLTDMADQYYNQGKTQSEIAACYGTNRFKVAKLLQDARTEQIVEIQINYSNERNKAIEKELRDAFPLDRALVVNTQYSPYIDSLRQLGKVGADYLNRTLQPGSVLGVTWGKTIYSVISQLQGSTYNPVTAIQLTGCLKLLNPATDSRELVRSVASAYCGSYHYLDAPLYVQNSQVREMLLREPLIQGTISMTGKMTTVITGIGGRSSLPLSNPTFFPYLTERDREQADKCIGSIYGYVLDQNGQIADIDLNHKLIAAPLKNVLSTPHRFAVVYGRHKAEMTCKALQNRLFNEILTDTDTALHLLELVR